jgi:PAS domain S-box-containing protein
MFSKELSKHLKPVVDDPAAADPRRLADRKDLASVAVERTRMPMVVSDPRQPDNPIVLANKAFLELSGYSAEEVIGRNCRFLQGPRTSRHSVELVRQAIAAEKEITIELLNYRKDGTTFWNELFLSPVHDDEGHLLYFFGSSKDISKRRQAQDLEAEEYRLLREVDHRAKNALALVQGIVRLSRAETAEAYAEAVQGRVEALAQAHSLLAAERWRDVPLERLIQTESKRHPARRVRLNGSAVALAPEQVQPLALVLHEMFSNACQHGALATTEGSVSIDWYFDETAEMIVLDWQESGGPAPAASPVPGFGSILIDATINRQLSGTVSYDWQPAGLRSRISMPVAQMNRARPGRASS